MNATQWTSLTGLCKYLGKESKCVVDETEKGWYIQYIDKDPQVVARQAAIDQQQKADLNEEERTRRMLAAQVAAAKSSGGTDQEDDNAGPRELVRGDGDVKLELKMTNFAKAAGPLRPGAKVSKAVDFQAALNPLAPHSSTGTSNSSTSNPKKKMSNIDALMAETEKKKATLASDEDKNNRTDYWLTEGIVVKVMNKKVGDGKFYKEKGVVSRVIDRYVGEVRLDNSGTKIRLDQEDLETVVPKVGRTGLILNGRCRGSEVEVMQIHENDFCCDVKVISSKNNGVELKGVEYEDLSKLA
jgi:DNA/RNA-binding protein KIN17